MLSLIHIQMCIRDRYITVMKEHEFVLWVIGAHACDLSLIHISMPSIMATAALSSWNPSKQESQCADSRIIESVSVPCILPVILPAVVSGITLERASSDTFNENLRNKAASCSGVLWVSSESVVLFSQAEDVYKRQTYARVMKRKVKQEGHRADALALRACLLYTSCSRRPEYLQPVR